MAELTIDQALQQGVEAHKAGQIQEADRLYTAILQAQPKHPDANHNMGVLAVGVGKVQEALPFFKTALEANPSTVQFWLSYIDTLIKLNKLAEAKAVLDQAKSKGAKGDGFDKLEQSLNQTSKVQDPPQDQLQSLINLHSQGQLQQALKQAEILVQQFPKSPVLFNIQGALLKGLGQLDQSIDAYNKALAIKPDYADAYNNMGNALKEQGKLEETIEAYKKALVVKPNYAEAYYNMGNALKQQGKLEEAIEAYNKALAIKPDYAEVRHMISSLTGEKTTSPPRQYIENLFDGYSKKFEESLVGNLEYKIPKLLTDIIAKEHGGGSLGSVLDLGCGTGLTGLEIKDFCSKLEGVDLSKKMLGLANAKNVYDKLVHTDILDYLANTDLCFDYFIATDVFIYVGDLKELFRLIKSRNKQKGKLAFSAEKNTTESFLLETSGRYSHSKSYIEGLCKEFDYSLSYYSEVDLRKEKGTFLTGGLYLLDF